MPLEGNRKRGSQGARVLPYQGLHWGLVAGEQAMCTMGHAMVSECFRGFLPSRISAWGHSAEKTTRYTWPTWQAKPAAKAVYEQLSAPHILL